jgi:hypothetical protein
MNSKQRRKDRRMFKYSVRISNDKRSANGYDNMFDWCTTTFGNSIRTQKICSWREKHHYVGTYWQFSTETGASLFALKWA